MVIKAGGRKWIVDAHAVAGTVSGSQCWEVTFRHASGDRVEMRWIPRPDRLTQKVARALFELAGERLWRDPRTGAVHRIHLVDEGLPGGDADLRQGRIMVRFRTAGGTATLPWTLEKPLGLATDAELAALSDEAFQGMRAAPA